MRKLIASSLLLCLLVGTTSCTSYWKNRAGDMADIVRIQGIAGLGLGAKVDVTQYVHVGALWYEGHTAGFANREFGVWESEVCSWGLLYGRHNEEIGGAPFYSHSYGWNHEDGGFDFVVPGNPFVDTLMVRVQVMAIFLGIDIQLRSGELLLDGIGGFFGWDPSNDDIY